MYDTYCHLEKTQIMNKISSFSTAKNIIVKLKKCDKGDICIKN